VITSWTLCCCCSYAVGRTTHRHPATSSRIFFPLHLFSPRSCHRLVHCRTSSIHAVLLFPGKHFPSISPSIVARTTLSLLLFQWQYLESFRCLICSKLPFSSGIPVFSQIHVFVFHSIQLILSIWCHTHISKALTSFSSHFFSAQLSDTYNAVLHISDGTSYFFRSIRMYFAFQIPVSCRVAYLAIVSLAIISVDPYTCAKVHHGPPKGFVSAHAWLCAPKS